MLLRQIIEQRRLASLTVPLVPETSEHAHRHTHTHANALTQIHVKQQ